MNSKADDTVPDEVATKNTVYGVFRGDSPMTGKLLWGLLCPWHKHSVVAHWELETVILWVKI